MNPFYLGVCLAVLSANGFGMIPIFAKYAYQGGTTVTTLLFLRFSLAALFFFGFIFIRRVEIRVSRSTLLALFILGSVLYMMQSNFYFSAVRYIPASLAVLLFYTYPVFVAIIASLVDREKMTGHIVGAIAVSMTGLVLVLGTTPREISLYGILLAAAAGLVYSCYIVLGSRVLKQLPVMVASAFVTLFASFSFLFMGLAGGTLQFDITPRAWYAVAGLVLFSTIMAVFTFFKGIELIGSTRASILSMVEPLTTIGFSALLFQERLSWLQLIGGAAVLCGALLVITSGRAEAGPDTGAETGMEVKSRVD